MNKQNHRRKNPLTGDWVLVSPQRVTRPWQGKQETPIKPSTLQHDSSCYLCAGNTRSKGQANPDYKDTFVFTNDFPALEEAPLSELTDTTQQDPLFINEAVSGTSRVICFSPDHSMTLPQMSEQALGKVITCWIEQIEDLKEQHQWIQIFENKGDIMGCSNPHPHGQIWAQNSMPSLAQKVEDNSLSYFEHHGSNLLLDYAQQEIELKDRIVDLNEDWVSLVPYWASWPFELLVIPLKPAHHLNDLSASQQQNLAKLLKCSLSRYDNLFQCSFPYSMGWHGQPFNGNNNQHWQVHAHFYPPLLRSAAIQKFMVGYEMLAEAQRDITPEQAAEQLRACSSTHYLVA